MRTEEGRRCGVGTLRVGRAGGWAGRQHSRAKTRLSSETIYKLEGPSRKSAGSAGQRGQRAGTSRARVCQEGAVEECGPTTGGNGGLWGLVRVGWAAGGGG